MLSANLYATTAVPEVVYVELRADALLPAREAYGLGRVLIGLGKVARDASTEAPQPH
jgi:hypothetical protein